MEKGDIVLVRFPFTNYESSKLRPAVVLVPENKYGDICLAFITSKILEDGGDDILIINEDDDDFRKTGLKTDSTIRAGKIVTLQKNLIVGKIGALSSRQIKKFNKILKKIFQL